MSSARCSTPLLVGTLPSATLIDDIQAGTEHCRAISLTHPSEVDRKQSWEQIVYRALLYLPHYFVMCHYTIRWVAMESTVIDHSSRGGFALIYQNPYLLGVASVRTYKYNDLQRRLIVISVVVLNSWRSPLRIWSGRGIGGHYNGILWSSIPSNIHRQ